MELNKKKSFLSRSLDTIERLGNKLPDPAILFFLLMILVWVLSALFSGMSFTEIDPRSGSPMQINNLLSGAALTTFMATMVSTFMNFAPLGVVLVAMLGLGVAEHTGFINSSLKSILNVTPKMLITPVLIMVGILSHIAVDAGYVLVIPLGGVIFYAAGRHPLAGIAAAFVGVSGGFSCTMFIPSSLDPMLAGLTQEAANLSPLIGDTKLMINPLNNFYFTSASVFLVVVIGWFITDRIIEPRLKSVKVDGDSDDMPVLAELNNKESKGLKIAGLSMLLMIILLVVSALPETSAWRSVDTQFSGQLLHATAPLMKSIVPIIFIFFLIPGIIYGYIAGTVKDHRDIVKGMSKSMSGMGYYIVMAFFAAQFIYAFGQSNMGALLAIKGAHLLKAMSLPMAITIFGIVLLSGGVNLLVGSASAKWALIGAVMVPMLMELGISPDLTQAAYRVGDSSTNIITPLLPYFPLIVVFCQKYVKSTGVGTLISIMLPYSIALLLLWTIYLMLFWAFGFPLGVQSSYQFAI